MRYNIKKSDMKDKMGRAMTQGLFLEFNYDPEFAIFTFDGEDKEYKGKHYVSLKKLFLETEDPTEYIFANLYLVDWDHWQKLNANKILRKHFDKWRNELELSIRATAIRGIIDNSDGEKGFQASKWLADRGWDKRAAGRPSKDELAKNTAINEQIADEYAQDSARLKLVK